MAGVSQHWSACQGRVFRHINALPPHGVGAARRGGLMLCLQAAETTVVVLQTLQLHGLPVPAPAAADVAVRSLDYRQVGVCVGATVVDVYNYRRRRCVLNAFQ